MDAAVKVTRLEHTPAALRTIAAKSGNVEQSRRLLAIALVPEGTLRVDAARQTGMDRQTLRDWVHRYNALGVDGLISRTAPGPRPKLTPSQMAELRQLVIDGPDPNVHKVIRWSGTDLQGEVARRFEVTVDDGTIGRWLGQLGLTRLQPRRYHPKRDLAAQEAFKNVWPAPSASSFRV